MNTKQEVLEEVQKIMTEDGGWMSFSAIFNRTSEGSSSEKARSAVDGLLKSGQIQMIHGPVGLEYALQGVPLPSNHREPAKAVRGNAADVQVTFAVPAPKVPKWRDPAAPIKKLEPLKPAVQTKPAPPPKPDRSHQKPLGESTAMIKAIAEEHPSLTVTEIAAKITMSHACVAYHLRKLGLLESRKSRPGRWKESAPVEHQRQSRNAVSAPFAPDAPKIEPKVIEATPAEIVKLINSTERLPDKLKSDLPPATFALWSTGELRIEWDDQHWAVLDTDETNGLIAYLQRMGALKVAAA